MARSVWNGNLSVGLLNVPVKVVNAVRERPIRFHMLHAKDGARLRTVYVCSQDGQQVPWEETVKGYEFQKGEYVEFTHDELGAIEAVSNHLIEIDRFVDATELDPAYYHDAYYLVPPASGIKAYQVLREALARSGKAGIGRFVTRGKERMVAIRPRGDAIQLTSLHRPSELIDEAAALGDLEKPTPGDREVEAALALIDRLSGPFEPDSFRSDYEERLKSLIAQKREGRTVEPIAAEPIQATPPSDLLAVLEASLAEARRRSERPREARERVGSRSVDDGRRARVATEG